jgi:hypothetical protein
MMNEKNIGETYLVEAIQTTVYVLNKAHLRPQSGKTPYELWYGRPASIKHFKVFGSKCYIKNNDENLRKCDDRDDEGIFLGYATNSKGYRCYNKKLHKMVDCIDVKVDEGILEERCTIMSLLQRTQLKMKMNRSKNHKINILNQMKTQILRQTQISRQPQIPPPESLKRIILQVR